MRVEYNIDKVQDTSYPLSQYGLLDVHSPVAPGLTAHVRTRGEGRRGSRSGAMQRGHAAFGRGREREGEKKEEGEREKEKEREKKREKRGKNRRKKREKEKGREKRERKERSCAPAVSAVAITAGRPCAQCQATRSTSRGVEKKDEMANKFRCRDGENFRRGFQGNPGEMF
jgi:hypothetical protein